MLGNEWPEVRQQDSLSRAIKSGWLLSSKAHAEAQASSTQVISCPRQSFKNSMLVIFCLRVNPGAAHFLGTISLIATNVPVRAHPQGSWSKKCGGLWSEATAP